MKKINRDKTTFSYVVGGHIPHNMARPLIGPPTLERSGSEHRAGRFPSSSLRGEDRDERWSLP